MVGNSKKEEPWLWTKGCPSLAASRLSLVSVLKGGEEEQQQQQQQERQRAKGGKKGNISFFSVLFSSLLGCCCFEGRRAASALYLCSNLSLSLCLSSPFSEVAKTSPIGRKDEV